MREDRELKALMRDIENETIDKSEWLKRTDVQCLTDRHKERNKDYVTIFDVLLAKGYVGYEHRDYGLDYIELKNSIYGNMKSKSCISLFINGADTRITRDRAGKIFSIASKKIGIDAETTVLRALDQKPYDALRFEFVSNVYRLAFETLADELIAAIKKVMEDEEKELA